MSFSKFTRQDLELIAREYESLLESARARCADREELDVVQKAFDFANLAHKNVRRRSGEPYILHPIQVAKIVVDDIGLGYKSIAAALLHDVVEDTDYSTEDIRNLFGDKIASLVDGLTKIKTVLDNEDKSKSSTIYTESLQAENFKRILLTLNDDVRVVLIKLADRLHNCRTIEFMPEHKRDKILSETMFIFIPLAHRLGLYEVKSEMENIWLRYKEPDAYNEISQRISQNVMDKDREIEEFIAPIDESLRKAGFNFTIRKRLKTPYSIWRKMQTKNISFEQVYDLYAVRIIFTPDAASQETERDQCYHIFSIITGIYRYNASRIRDWVKHPKSNGYEALHCTLMSRFGVWIEVQIRSKRMDDIAEKGIAAHWAYKKDGYITENDSEMDRWLLQVKEILLQKDFNALELLDIIHSDLTRQDIVVFTPKGEQRTIRKGATALDFAYLIHTHIGNKAIAAKVNMRLVPLSHVLKSGDQVEIITAGNGEPKREWLSFLQTRHAITQVVTYFRADSAAIAAEGEKKFKEYLHSNGRRFSSVLLKRILYSRNIPNAEEFYFRFGLGMVKTADLDAILTPRPEAFTSSSATPDNYIIASCCNPIPGDPVLGFRHEDGHIEVHKKSCKEAERLASRFGDRMVVPKWAFNAGESAFPVRISLRGIDRMGLMNEISQYISLVMGVNMKKIYLAAEQGLFEGYIELLVHDKSALELIIRSLGTIDGIQNVVRSDI